MVEPAAVTGFGELKDIAQVNIAEARIQSLTKQIAEIQRQLADLVIVAPIDGKVVEAPRVKEPTIEQKREQLAKWHGTPLEPRNLGCVLDERTHLLSIAPNNKYQAIVLIDQADRNELADRGINLGDKLAESKDSQRQLDLKFEHLAWKTYHAEIVEFSKSSLNYAPELLSTKAGGKLPTVTDKQGREKLVSPVYQATLVIEEDSDLFRSGMHGLSRFLVDRRTAGSWVMRYLYRTFYFKL